MKIRHLPSAVQSSRVKIATLISLIHPSRVHCLMLSNSKKFRGKSNHPIPHLVGHALLDPEVACRRDLTRNKAVSLNLL